MVGIKKSSDGSDILYANTEEGAFLDDARPPTDPN